MAIQKQLAGMQDLLTTVGATQQVRGGATVNVQGISVPYAVTAIADMQALDITVYTYARVFNTTTSYTDYIYDPNRFDGVPSDTGTGTWIVAAGSGSGDSLVEEPQTLTAGQTVVNYATVNCNTAAFYVCSGSMADRGRLCAPGDFIILSDTSIELTSSYPTGTILLAVGNESAVIPNTLDVAVFENVAQMKLADLLVGQVVKTRGYTTTNDGGGALYTISDPQSVDGFGDHIISNGNSAIIDKSLFVTAKQYGAIADDSTDNTSAVSALLAVNATVVFTEGIYQINPIEITSNNNLRVFGPGMLKVIAGNDCHAVRFNSCDNLIIDGLQVDGNKDNTNDNQTTGRGCLDVIDSSDTTIVNCYLYQVKGFSSRLNNIDGFTYSNNGHRDFTRNAVQISGNCVDYVVSDNWFKSQVLDIEDAAHVITAEATAPDSSRRGLITDNTIYANCAGIQLTNEIYDTVVSNNKITASATNNGIKLDGSRTGIVVESNTVFAGSLYGFFDVATDPYIFRGNIIYNQVTFGARIRTASAEISDNTFYGSPQSINVDVNDVIVSNNKCFDYTSRGISAGDSALRSGIIVVGNLVNTRSAGGDFGIYVRSANCVVTDNTCLNNDQYPVTIIDSVVDGVFGPNTFRGNTLGDVYRGNDIGSQIDNTFNDAIFLLSNLDQQQNLTHRSGNWYIFDDAVDIADSSHPLNTKFKVTGRSVYDRTNDRVMIAQGTSSTDAWVSCDGSVTVNPS